MKKLSFGDFHLHTSFSGDSDSPMSEMIEKGISLGLSTMCFTEHMDYDYPKDLPINFEVDTDAYYKGYQKYREKYKDQIELLFGVEIGLRPDLKEHYHKYLASYPFDFVIGSTHYVHEMDPYYPEFFEGRTEEAAYLDYFESALDNLDSFNEMDVYGHIDYVVRYGPNKNREYSYKKFEDILDTTLRTLIAKNVGIELNTGGFKYGLGHPNPCEEILKRYRELGGEIITLGSDAHAPEYIAYEFSKSREILKSCGFKYYTVFHQRTPSFLPL